MIESCIEVTAFNYNVDANTDDGSCESKEIGDIFQGGYIIQINDDGSGLVADLVDLGPGLMWNQAIDAAINSNSQGYNDWRLPNLEELELMYNTIGLGGPYGNIGNFELHIIGLPKKMKVIVAKLEVLDLVMVLLVITVSSILVLELVLFVHFLL